VHTTSASACNAGSGQPQRAELTTLRWRLFSCGAVFSHAAGKPTLMLAVATAKRRDWCAFLFHQMTSKDRCDAVSSLSAGPALTNLSSLRLHDPAEGQGHGATGHETNCGPIGQPQLPSSCEPFGVNFSLTSKLARDSR